MIRLSLDLLDFFQTVIYYFLDDKYLKAIPKIKINSATGKYKSETYKKLSITETLQNVMAI